MSVQASNDLQKILTNDKSKESLLQEYKNKATTFYSINLGKKVGTFLNRTDFFSLLDRAASGLLPKEDYIVVSKSQDSSTLTPNYDKDKLMLQMQEINEYSKPRAINSSNPNVLKFVGYGLAAVAVGYLGSKSYKRFKKQTKRKRK